MYRILIARGGSYYVQKHFSYGWKKVGGFFNTRSGARRFVNDHRYVVPRTVVEYL